MPNYLALALTKLVTYVVWFICIMPMVIRAVHWPVFRLYRVTRFICNILHAVLTVLCAAFVFLASSKLLKGILLCCSFIPMLHIVLFVFQICSVSRILLLLRHFIALAIKKLVHMFCVFSD